MKSSRAHGSPNRTHSVEGTPTIEESGLPRPIGRGERGRPWGVYFSVQTHHPWIALRPLEGDAEQIISISNDCLLPSQRGVTRSSLVVAGRGLTVALLIGASTGCADSFRAFGGTPAAAQASAEQMFEAFATRF